MESMFRGIRNARRVGFARSFPPTLYTLERQGDYRIYRIDTRFIRSEDPDKGKKRQRNQCQNYWPDRRQMSRPHFSFTRAERNVTTTKNVYLGKVTRKGQRVRGVFG